MSSVIKQQVGYTFQDEDKRVIDTNELVARRIELLSEIMQKQAEKQTNFESDFTQGLDAVQVGRLVSEDGEEFEDEQTVIKAQPQGPTQEELDQMCEEILAKANEEAEDIVAAARQEAEAILENSKEEGYKAGYDAGYSEGHDEAVAIIEGERESLLQRRKELEEEYENMVSELEPRFIALLSSIYEHIFHVKLAENKEVVFYLIQDAIRKVEGNKNFIIHVSKEDYGFVSMQKKELLAGLAVDSAEIVEDMTLHANECFIETSGGIFDCSLETQLAGLKRELTLLSFISEE